LVNEGLIMSTVGRSRGLRLANDENRHKNISVTLPVMSRIAAGRLIEAVQDEDEIDPGGMFAGRGRFVLKVNGDSMID
jgi:repressor LexA